MHMPQEYEFLSPGIQHTRLLWVECQPETLHEVLNPRHLAVWPSWRQQHKVVGETDQTTSQVTALHTASEVPVQQVEVHVRK